MSQFAPPPPPGQHGPGPYVPAPGKPPPRRLWYVVGAGLMVAALLVFVGGLFWTLRPLLAEDAVFAAGEAHRVELPAGEERAIFVPVGATGECAGTDADGQPLDFRGPGGRYTVNDWLAVQVFDTGAGDVELRCETSPAGDVRVGQVPGFGALFGGIAVAVLLPMVLGFAGLVVLILTLVLRSQRTP